MNRRIKKFIIAPWTLFILMLSMAACGREDMGISDETAMEGISERQKDTASGTEADVVEEAIVQGELTQAVKEIPVEFSDNFAYSLTLAQLVEAAGEYELRLYDDSGAVLQQISCGMLTEPLSFSYDVLCSSDWENLEIFSADSDTGLLFRWDQEKDRFSEDTIVIPRYVEILGNGGMLTIEEENPYQIKKIYQVNQFQGCVDEIRRWQFNRDTGELKIWDCLEEQSLFEGTAALNEEGDLLNEEYYTMLFQDDRHVLWDFQEDSSISMWFDEPRSEETEISQGTEGFEYVQREVFGNDGHADHYENREALLADFGFQNSTPTYRYFDRCHNLQLELYEYEDSDHFLGIVYQYYFDDKKKKGASMYGFTINNVQEQKWENRDLYSAKTVFGDDAAKYVGDAEEITEYTPSGETDCFRVEGWMEQEEDDGIKDILTTVLEVNYIYRDDGTLYKREYWHEPRCFSTTLSSMESFYDEKGRVIFESGYITHGTLEYYYIYKDEGDKPAYCLEIDHNMGYAIPNLIRYN